MSPKISLDQPGAYRIRVQGVLDKRWMDYFDEVEIKVEISPDGSKVSTLTGCFQDQAAVQGMLQKLYNLGFPLLSAEKINIS